MATELLSRKDAYIKEFHAEVLKCEAKGKLFEVVLDKTAFYPEGGGQPGDTGLLNEAKVTDTHEKNGEVIHYCDRPLEAGTTVSGRIDWTRRFDHMQHHSAEHIVSGLVHMHFGYDNVGFHMGNIVTVDFNGDLSPEEVLAIEQEANAVVYDDVEVIEEYPSPEELKTINYRSKKELTGEVRIVTIPGADVCACCGTHVKRTGEIGVIKLTAPQKYKGGVRIEVIAGRKALLDYDNKDNINFKLSHLFSAKPMEVYEAAEARMAEIDSLKLKVKALQNEIFSNIADSIEDKTSPVFLNKDLDGNEIKELTLTLMKKREGVNMVVSVPSKGPAKFCLGVKEGDLREVSRDMLKKLNGKGGGAANILQGVINAPVEEAEKLFFETFKK